MWLIDQKRKIQKRLNIRHMLEASKETAGQQQNPLAAEIVISFTSFAPRFGTLHQVVQSLLWQSVQADRVVLYLKKGEEHLLPDAVKRLASDRFLIEWRDDNRSYDKLIHALTDFPDAYIITVDDDIVYSATLVEQLVKGRLANPNSISCLRGHRVTFSHDGYLLPYLSWKFNALDQYACQPSTDLMPTGVGGVLYPPRSLDSQAIDIDTAKRLAPTADDAWFYWMARLAGTTHVKVGENTTNLLYTEGSQESGLVHNNWDGANDRQIRALWAEFGRPQGLDERVRLRD
ncbi:hypothetical protein ACTHQV_13500 [Sphingomonas sp. SAFR-052]